MEELKITDTNGNGKYREAMPAGKNQLTEALSGLTGKDKYYLVEILEKAQAISGANGKVSIEQVIESLKHYEEKLGVLPRAYTVDEVAGEIKASEDFQKVKAEKGNI